MFWLWQKNSYKKWAQNFFGEIDPWTLVVVVLSWYAKLTIMIIHFCCDDSLNSTKWQMMSMEKKSSLVISQKKESYWKILQSIHFDKQVRVW